MRYLIFMLVVVCMGCSKRSNDILPVFIQTGNDTSINLMLTYHGDTTPNTQDAVFAYGLSNTDTLRGITNRSDGAVYNWRIPLSHKIHSYSLMRKGADKWMPVNSGTVH